MLNNNEIFSVSDITNLLKQTIENNFSKVKIKGEFSQITKSSIGHIYTSLKDNDAIIKAVIWKSTPIPFNLEEGMEVIVTGKISLYPTRGEYQIIITSIEMAGIGAILKMLEERKQKLAKEGLFDENHKKTLPFLPSNIGIITSPTGAAFQDIKNRLTERLPVNIFLYPATVQGESAAGDVIKGILYFNKNKNVDIIIIARGGGSIEDLLPFSDENLVREVFKSQIPIISGVGHEPDWMLIDFVADKRAATPTMAAEIVLPTKLSLFQELNNFNHRLTTYITNLITINKNKINLINIKSPKQLIMELFQKLDDKTQRLNIYIFNKINFFKQKLLIIPDLKNIIYNKIENEKQKLNFISNLLNSLSYKNTLKRGFAIIRVNDKIISKKNDFKKPAMIEFDDGTININ